MYNYPKSIEDAAKILDEALPGWHNQIKIPKLNMNRDSLCILGQLYLDYPTGMLRLFNVSNKVSDSIFGTNSNREAWIEQINKRKQNMKLELPTITVWIGQEEVKVMKAKNGYYIKEDGTVLRPDEVSLTKPKLYFKDLQVGDKFTIPEISDCQYVKICHNGDEVALNLITYETDYIHFKKALKKC